MSEVEASKPIQSRRAAREAALQALYQSHLGNDRQGSVQDVLSRYHFAPETAAFAAELATGCLREEATLTETIRPHLDPSWPLDRLAWTDRCILILAAYELLHLPEMPPKVTIDEAVSLAKRFGSADSGKFVNGVLGSLLKATPKQSWQPHAGESVFDEQEEPIEEPEVEVIEEGTPLHDEVVKAGAWTIRARPGAN